MIVRMLRVMTAGAIFILATGAQAQEANPKPWYVSAGAGGAWNLDQTISGTGGLALSTDTGFGLNAAIGRYLDEVRVIRLEAETVYENTDVNNISGVKAAGTLSNVGLMLNLLYDIHTDSAWIPYLGGGLGYARVNMDNVTAGGVQVLDGTDYVFAYQFKAGIAYQFNPSMAVTVGYRFYATDNPSFGGQPGGTVKTEGTRTQNAEVGFRFHF
jgi:opacity protein-like surface antigen